MQKIIVKIGVAILVIALVDLVYVNYWMIKDQGLKINPPAGPLRSEASEAGDQNIEQTETIETKKLSEETTFTPIPSSTVEPKAETSQTIIQTSQKEIFIPIGSGSTKSNSYEDLAGLEVTIDTNKYSEIDSIVFEASLWVEGGNGKMYAQLYNSGDKRPVWFSEISSISAKGILTTSSKINLEKGSRVYKVQAKTDLTSYAAHVDNARIKITLE